MNIVDFQFYLVIKFVEIQFKFIGQTISSLMYIQDFQLQELFFCFIFLMFYPFIELKLQNIWVLLIEIILFEM